MNHSVYWYKRRWRANKLRKISIASKRGISRRFAVPSDWLQQRFHVPWRADNFGEQLPMSRGSISEQIEIVYTE